MKNIKLSKKTYLFAFVFVMTLNAFLTIFLLRTVLAQTFDKTPNNQLPVKAEVLKQDDNPLLITVANIDNTAESYQTINYTVQNVSSKKIKAFVLLHADKSGAGGASIRFLQSLASGQIIRDSISVARANVKSEDILFLSLDYVEFEDGSSWGKDSQQQSEYILGHNEGQKSVITHVKELLISRNKDAVLKLLQEQIAETNSPVIDTKKTAKWQDGFAAGYKTILVRLQFAYEKQGIDAVSIKLEEVEKLIKKEEK